MRDGMPDPDAPSPRDLVDDLAEVVFRTDDRGNWSYLSAAWTRLTGFGVAGSIGGNLLDVVDPADRGALAGAVLADVCDGGEVTRHEFRLRRSDGTTVWAEVRARILRDATGAPVAGTGTIVDVGDRRARDDLLADETAVLELVVLDRPLQEVLGATATMVARHTGRRTSVVEFAPTGQPRVHDPWAVVVTAGPDGTVERGLVAGSDGGTAGALPIRLPGTTTTLGAMVVDQAGLGPTGREVVDRALDLASVAIWRRRTDAEVRRQALYDPLTSLPNRALLGDRMRQVVGEARRGGHLAAVLLLDLDGFKRVNDTLGHDMGDRVLCEVGRRLEAALRDVDTVGRLGGDEFVVVLAEVEGVEAAVRVAAKLEDALRPPFLLDGVGLRVGASIGIALYPDHGDEFDVLLRRADAAMYRRKPEGGGVAVFEPDADGGRMARVAVAARLSRGIDDGDLVVEYQPKLDLADGRVVGVEALVRWRQADGTLLPPAEFIELAEGTGSIRPLTKWVLERAVADVGRWRVDHPDLTLAVNLAAPLLTDEEMVAWIRAAVGRWQLEEGQLELEVHEQALLLDPPAAISAMRTLDRVGVAFALDDFGTGFSSVSYVQRVPVRILKIDPSFVAASARRARDMAIIAATVQLAHTVGITVVAEGVEDERARRSVADLGCDQAQGFHLAAPMPAAELGEWLAACAG